MTFKELRERRGITGYRLAKDAGLDMNTCTSAACRAIRGGPR
jgi:hypothetical protein